VILQLLAFAEARDLFTNFLDGKPFDTGLVDDFFARKKNPLWAYYLRGTKKYSQAVEVFREEGRLDEVRDTLVLAGSDFSFIETQMRWFVPEDPVLAFSVFADPKISPARALDFCRREFRGFELVVLDAILEQKDILNRAHLAKTRIEMLCGLLLEVRKPAPDRAAFALCEPLIRDPGADTQTVSDWVNQRLIAVCRQDRHCLSIEEMRIVFDGLPPEIVFSLFRELKAYESAIGLLSEWNGDLGVFEDLCRESPVLLPAFFAGLREKVGPEELRETVCRLIGQTIFAIDLPAALEFLDGAMAVDEISDCLEKWFSALNSRRIAAELRLAFAEADEFESAYERVVLQAQVVALSADSVCAKCGGVLASHFVERKPDGQLFHFQCLH
jgi:hypothetical protein